MEDSLQTIKENKLGISLAIAQSAVYCAIFTISKFLGQDNSGGLYQQCQVGGAFFILFSLVRMKQTGAWNDLLSLGWNFNTLLIFGRSLCSSSGLLLAFLSVQYLRVSTMNALMFTYPLISLVLSGVFLNEPLNSKDWFKIGACLFGLVLITKPFMLNEKDSFVGILLGISTALTLSSVPIFSRYMSKKVDSSLWYLFIGLLCLFLHPQLILLLGYEVAPPTTTGWILILAMSILRIIVINMFDMACRVSKLPVILPFDYLILIFSLLSNILVFGHSADLLDWTGSGIILVANFYDLYLYATIKRPLDKELV